MSGPVQFDGPGQLNTIFNALEHTITSVSVAGRRRVRFAASHRLLKRPLLGETAGTMRWPEMADLGLRTRRAMLRRLPYLGFGGMGMTFGSAKRPVASGVTR